MPHIQTITNILFPNLPDPPAHHFWVLQKLNHNSYELNLMRTGFFHNRMIYSQSLPSTNLHNNLDSVIVSTAEEILDSI